jgi:hypothetical protein
LARLRPTTIGGAARSPVATLILGLGWGVWHIALYGLAGFVVPLVLAFFYSWLYNRTQSFFCCAFCYTRASPLPKIIYCCPSTRRWSTLCCSEATSWERQCSSP